MTALSHAIAGMDAKAAEVMQVRRERYLQTYDRKRELARLLYANPLDLPGHADAVKRLERAAEAEERRCAAGHWTYEPGRHEDILGALEAERIALRKMERPDTGRRAMHDALDGARRGVGRAGSGLGKGRSL